MTVLIYQLYSLRTSISLYARFLLSTIMIRLTDEVVTDFVKKKTKKWSGDVTELRNCMDEKHKK